jgi:hypothetical protein
MRVRPSRKRMRGNEQEKGREWPENAHLGPERGVNSAWNGLERSSERDFVVSARVAREVLEGRVCPAAAVTATSTRAGGFA